MRDEDISRADISQQYENTLFLYDDRLVFCTSMGEEDKDIVVFDLMTQKSKTVPFTFKKVAPPKRIGFVNSDGAAVYISRIPKRKMHVGLSANTISIEHIQDAPPDAIQIVRRLARMRAVEIFNAMNNEYPTLQEAWKMIKTGDHSVAFDHQFCVDRRANVFYKTEEVGVVNVPYRDELKIEHIEFYGNNQHLRCLLDGNYANSPRIA